MRAGPASARFVHAAWVAIVLLASSAAPRSQASDPVPVVAPSDDDSIAAAKRQLDALKSDATSRAAGVHADALPTVAVPEFNASPGPSTPVSRDENAAPTKTKDPSNWLLDAMAKPKGKVEGRRRRRDEAPRSGVAVRDSAWSSGATSDDEDDDNDVRSQRGEKTATAASAHSEETRALDAAKAPPNPLTQYLSQWLSSQDYALLRPTLDASSSDSRREAVPSPVDPGAGLAPLATDFDAFAGRSEPIASKPSDNPYLQFLAPPDPAPPVVQAPAPAAAAALLPPTPERAAPSTATPALPDFVRPNSDDKYFKPLKRF